MNDVLSTSNFKKVHEACADALIHRKLIGVVSDPRQGLTTSFQYFASTYSQYCVYANYKAARNVESLVANLMTALTGQGATSRVTVSSLITYLKNSEACLLPEKGFVILIDDFMIALDTVCFVQSLYRECLNRFSGLGIGLVLGLSTREYHKLNSRIDREPLLKSFTRSLSKVKLLPLRKDEIAEICRARGIVDQSIQRELLTDCKSIGDLHITIKSLERG